MTLRGPHNSQENYGATKGENCLLLPSHSETGKALYYPKLEELALPH